MKIVQEETAYIQKQDAIQIIHMERANASLMAQIVEFSGGHFYCNGGEDRFEFMKVGGEDVIRWLNSQEWILDYSEVKDMTEKEAVELGQSLADKKNNLARKFNNMNKAERKENYGKIYDQCENLMGKMHQLADYIHYLRGDIDFQFPAEIEPPVRNLKKGAKKSGIIGRIRSLFSK
ncbi:hypothetical protein IJI76_02205 [Candidatus Saccharibacteria bacterium]|nr:hypothetical protein [Candidatus Saccharibacteria bacterium]